MEQESLGNLGQIHPEFNINQKMLFQNAGNFVVLIRTKKNTTPQKTHRPRSAIFSVLPKLFSQKYKKI